MHRTSQKHQELRELFLTLWDKAVGTPDYNKDEWMRLEQLLGINSIRPPAHPKRN